VQINLFPCFSKKEKKKKKTFVLINNLILLHRWALIAGRIPGRKAEEIERFWIMRHGEVFASRRRELKRYNS